MLSFLTTYWHILSALVFLALALIRLYIRFHDLEKEQMEHKEQHEKDIEQVNAATTAEEIQATTWAWTQS